MRKTHDDMGTAGWGVTGSPPLWCQHGNGPFGGCEYPKRCWDDSGSRRDSRRMRRQQGRSARIANERLWASRFGPHHGPRTARCPLVRARELLADPLDRDRIAGKPRDARGHEVIREISINAPEHLREVWCHNATLVVLCRLGVATTAASIHIEGF